ncbi:hypothetical protein DPMN_140909 [Dreissena polymorpha]|uniref:Uncharacterized protein n=1 Tax=Dreissena polymorpha TaxID=45954 RepID=A0A9D4GCD9_DREPO|nr:hypothetical protein DPMN_140909 [Dreissena polymorpha]
MFHGVPCSCSISILESACRLANKSLSNLNASDSGLQHTCSLMYEGGRHIGFGTTFENKMAAPTVQNRRKEEK